MDIVAGPVDFANRHIAPRYPNFSFVTLQRDNPAYDPWRHEGASQTVASLEEACAPEAMDLCIATSLFTHLDTGMARETLRAMQRALIRQGRAAFQFEHEHGEGAYVQNPSGPLGALAFTFDHFVRLLAEQRLYVERVLYGSWPGRPHHVSGQDILIVRRMPGD